MARNKVNSPNIIPPSAEYPNGRIKDNDGSNNGTPVNEFIYGDLHETFAKLMRRYAISYNNLPDNETNGFQIVEALRALPSKNNKLTTIGIDSTFLTAALKVASLEVNEVFVGLATVDSTGATNFKGTLDNQTKNINIIDSFKSGDFLLFINRANEIDIFTIYRSENFRGSERSLVLNQGGFELGQIGVQSGGFSYTTFGEISTAVKAGVFQAATDEVTLTFANEMPDINYKVRFDIESTNGTLPERMNYRGINFFEKTTTGCKMVINKNDTISDTSEFIIHIDVIKLKS